MDKLHAMQCFVETADAGSLSGAARRLDCSTSAVVRALAALETALGARLLQRTTRRLALTDEGRDYLTRCRQILGDVAEADAAVGVRHAQVSGRIRVTAPVVFGRLHVGGALAAFQRRHPGTVIEVLLLDRVVDLLDEGIDLAVRIGHLPDSTAVARPVGVTRAMICASRAYLKRHGTPRTPADLAGHRIIATHHSGMHWDIAGPDGPQRVPLTPALVTNHVELAHDACAAGLGIGRFLGYQIRQAVDAGQLVPLLERYATAPVPVQLVYPSARLLPLRLRLLRDHLLRTLGKSL